MEKCKPIIWYNSVDIFNPSGSHYEKFRGRPGFQTFSHLFSYFALNVSLADRTNSIKLPVDIQILDQCALPQFKPQTLSYDDICQQRARDLLDLARNQGKRLIVMYSGGIDSTLVLVSLLKVATKQELRDHVTVLLSEISQRENPEFYKNYVSRYFLRESSYLIHAYLGNPNYIIVTGEGNDQLFGSLVAQKIALDRGQSVILDAPNHSELIISLNYVTNNSKTSEKIVDIFDRVITQAPMEIPTLFHYFWWLNFVLKWQSVYTRLFCLTSEKYRSSIQPEVNYFSFFQTPQFQLWSMTNTDKMIQESWLSYKYHCKEIIYAFNGDAHYLKHKAKWGSLARVMFTRNLPKAVTQDMIFLNQDYPENIWNDDNDFI